MSGLDFLYLKQEDVIKAGVLDMKQTIEDVERVFRLYVNGEVIMPPKNLIDFYKDNEYMGHIVSMPCYIKDEVNVVGIKWAAGFPRNPARYGLPLGIDVIILSDPESGRPLAIMDGTIITAMRTSAVTGLAIKYLANPASRSVGVVGAGVIGRTTLMALPYCMSKLEEVKIFDIKSEKAKELVMEFKNTLPIEAVGSLEEAVRGRDVVITATTSSTKFIKPEWVEDGYLCIQVGTNEFDDQVVLKADKIVVDNWVQIKRYGRSMLSQLYLEGRISEDEILELPLIVAGKQKGRESPREIIFFDSFGMACEDVIVAYRIYRQALDQGLGMRIPLWERPLWK